MRLWVLFYERNTINTRQFAQVDDEDFERANQFKWCAHKIGNTFYAERWQNTNGVTKNISLHRFIINAKIVDHKDRDGLNCQKYNMRPCTISQNSQNTRPHKNSSSKYKGVCYVKKRGKWMSQIYYKKKNVILGFFKEEREAAIAYDLKASEYFGEFAYLNFKLALNETTNKTQILHHK